MIEQKRFPQEIFGTSQNVRTPVAAVAPFYKEAAYALLRITIGVLFLSTGIGKFMHGIGNFVGGMQQQFAGKLPMFMVTPFAYVLPFIEVTVGFLVLFGPFNTFGLILAGLLMFALTFGATMLGDPTTMAHNATFGLIIFVLLWMAEHNRYSVDRLLGRNVTPV